MTTPEGRRRSSPLTSLLVLGTLGIVGFAGMVAVAIWMNSGPGWQVSATNQPDGVLVEAFVGDAAKPNFSVVLEGRSISRDVVRATPEKFDPEVFKSSYRDPTISPGYWAFEIDGVPVGVVSSWMRVGDLTGDGLVLERGETGRYPQDAEASKEGGQGRSGAPDPSAAVHTEPDVLLHVVELVFDDGWTTAGEIVVEREGRYQYTIRDLSHLNLPSETIDGHLPSALMRALEQDVTRETGFKVVERIPTYEYGIDDHHVRHPAGIERLLAFVADEETRGRKRKSTK